MGKTKNNGIDLAREIIAMTKEYNRVITARNGEIRSLEQEAQYYKRREEAAKKSKDELWHDLEMEIEKLRGTLEKLRGTLETVTDIICKNITKQINGSHCIILWEDLSSDRKDFKKLMEALDIQLDVSEIESEEKENED